MIIHYNCTRQFLVALVVANYNLPSLFPFISIFTLVCTIIIRTTSQLWNLLYRLESVG